MSALTIVVVANIPCNTLAGQTVTYGSFFSQNVLDCVRNPRFLSAVLVSLGHCGACLYPAPWMQAALVCFVHCVFFCTFLHPNQLCSCLHCGGQSVADVEFRFSFGTARRVVSWRMLNEGFASDYIFYVLHSSHQSDFVHDESGFFTRVFGVLQQLVLQPGSCHYNWCCVRSLLVMVCVHVSLENCSAFNLGRATEWHHVMLCTRSAPYSCN